MSEIPSNPYSLKEGFFINKLNSSIGINERVILKRFDYCSVQMSFKLLCRRLVVVVHARGEPTLAF